MLGQLEEVSTRPVDRAGEQAAVNQRHGDGRSISGDGTQGEPEVEAGSDSTLATGLGRLQSQPGDGEDRRLAHEQFATLRFGKQQPICADIGDAAGHHAETEDLDANVDALRGAKAVDQAQAGLLAAGAVGDVGCLLRRICRLKLRFEITKQVVPAHEREE
jgi:hypothetical protein